MKCIDDEIPFEIPNGWEWCRFGQLVNHNPNVEAEDDCDAAFMPMKLIEAGYGSQYTFEVRKWKDVKTGFTKISVGDIAYAKITPCFQNRKSFILSDAPSNVAAATTELNIIRVYGSFTSRWYILFIFKSEYFIKEAKYKGTAGQQRVLSDYVKNKLIPLPPLAEQERIVNRILMVLPIADKYGKSQESLDKLNMDISERMRKSILQEAIQGKLVPQVADEGTATELFEKIREEKQKLVKDGKLKKSALSDSVIYKGDDNKYYEQVGSTTINITDGIPFDIPGNWNWCRLKDVCLIFTGATFKKEETNTENKGVRVLRGGNILPFKILINPDDLFLPHAKVKEDILLKRNDIVTPAVTSLENIGKAARASKDMTDVTVGGFVFILRSFLRNDWLSKCLLAFLSSPTLSEYMKSITNKSGQAFYNIGKERLSMAILPLPPLQEQQRIVAQIERLFEQLK